MEEDYFLDESKLPELKERLRRKLLIVIFPISISMVVLDMVVRHEKDIQMLSVLLFFTLAMTFVITKLSVDKSIELYRAYRLVVNENGVTSFFRIKKEIEWANAKLKVSDSGELTVVNMRLHWLQRVFSERGTIVIPLELINYEKLRLLIFKRSKRE